MSRQKRYLVPPGTCILGCILGCTGKLKTKQPQNISLNYCTCTRGTSRSTVEVTQSDDEANKTTRQVIKCLDLNSDLIRSDLIRSDPIDRVTWNMKHGTCQVPRASCLVYGMTWQWAMNGIAMGNYCVMDPILLYMLFFAVGLLVGWLVGWK